MKQAIIILILDVVQMISTGVFAAYLYHYLKNKK